VRTLEVGLAGFAAASELGSNIRKTVGDMVVSIQSGDTGCNSPLSGDGIYAWGFT